VESITSLATLADETVLETGLKHFSRSMLESYDFEMIVLSISAIDLQRRRTRLDVHIGQHTCLA
jgi:CO dehydrogenase nickel-insertion accessory protein CooC1